MIEVAGPIVVHSQPLHHAPRRNVVWHGERDDLLQPQPLEPELQRRAPGFGGVAVPPMFPRHSPTHLDAGREMGLEPHHGQPNKPQERRNPGGLDRP